MDGLRHSNYYYSGYHDMYQEDCEPPERTSIMSATDEELQEIPVEEQIRLLRAQVEELGNALNRCIEILNTFQNTSSRFMHCLEGEISHMDYEFRRHTDGFHAMLIIGHKEEEKDESTVP